MFYRNSNLKWKEGPAGSSDNTLLLPDEFEELIIWFKCNSNNNYNQIYHVPTKKFLNNGNNFITVGDPQSWLFVGFNINIGIKALICSTVLLSGSASSCTVYIWYR